MSAIRILLASLVYNNKAQKIFFIPNITWGKKKVQLSKSCHIKIRHILQEWVSRPEGSEFSPHAVIKVSWTRHPGVVDMWILIIRPVDGEVARRISRNHENTLIWGLREAGLQVPLLGTTFAFLLSLYFWHIIICFLDLCLILFFSLLYLKLGLVKAPQETLKQTFQEHSEAAEGGTKRAAVNPVSRLKRITNSESINVEMLAQYWLWKRPVLDHVGGVIQNSDTWLGTVFALTCTMMQTHICRAW